jgi:hypothetical protein
VMKGKLLKYMDYFIIPELTLTKCDRHLDART